MVGCSKCDIVELLSVGVIPLVVVRDTPSGLAMLVYQDLHRNQRG
jgi:hypothetical protein